jgi:hypothetical protein
MTNHTSTCLSCKRQSLRIGGDSVLSIHLEGATRVAHLTGAGP